MAFTLEDGTGVAGANAYISVEFYRAYWADRGHPIAADDDTGDAVADDDIQSWIVRGTDYVEKRFGRLYKGARFSATQGLGFPRCGLTYDGLCYGAEDTPPEKFKQGIAEYAKRVQVLDELIPDPPAPFDRTDASGETITANGAVTGKTEKIGPLEESVTYADPTSSGSSSSSSGGGWTMPAYPAADLLIQPFLKNSGGGVIH